MSTQMARTKECPQKVAEQHLSQMAQQVFVLQADLHIKTYLLQVPRHHSLAHLL